MTDIYLDPGAAALPDAADQLRHLTETGHRVFVLGDPPDALAGLPAITRAEACPRPRRRARGSSRPTRWCAASAGQR